MLNCATNYHDDLFSRLIGGGVPLPVAVERVAGAYLDGKPLQVGKRKLTKKERDSLFWSSNVVKDCPAESWHSEAMVLAVALGTILPFHLLAHMEALLLADQGLHFLVAFQALRIGHLVAKIMALGAVAHALPLRVRIGKVTR